jgi:hypothetical protein
MLVDTPFALFGVETEEIFDIDNMWSRGTFAEDTVFNGSQSEISLFFLPYLALPPPIFV